MGKKRIITEAGHVVEATAPKAGGKKKLSHGIIAIESTYNNTKMVLSDGSGNVVFWTSSGSLGFKGAKKGTPFAASKVAEIICDQAMGMGVKEINVVDGAGAAYLAAAEDRRQSALFSPTELYRGDRSGAHIPSQASRTEDIHFLPESFRLAAAFVERR
jgi:small subunit ribosomal protein S11